MQTQQSSILPTNILNIMYSNKVNVSYAGKTVWFSKYDPRVSDSKTPNEEYIKLKEGMSMEDVYEQGLKKLGLL